MKKLIAVVYFILLCLPSAKALAGDFGGVKAWGLGQAFTALQGDPECVYYNPAGLEKLDAMEFNLNFGSLYNAGNLGFLEGSVLAFPASMTSGIPLAVNINSQQLAGVTSQQAGVSAACKLYIFAPFYMGATIKWRSESAVNEQLVLADAGIQAKTFIDNLNWGLAVRNIFSGDDPLARITPALGLAYDSPFGLASGDFSWIAGKMYLSAGVERSLFNGLLPLRIGFYNAENSFITAGLGAYLWPVGFDTSFAWPINDKTSGYYQFSIKYKFGGEHFSEIYLNKAVERADALEEKVKRLEARQKEIENSVENNIAEKPVPVPTPKPVPAVKAVPEKPERAEPKPVKKVTWPQFHKVEPGDTLRDLAVKYYGDAGKWQLIYRANQDKITRGQPQADSELIIPEP